MDADSHAQAWLRRFARLRVDADGETGRACAACPAAAVLGEKRDFSRDNGTLLAYILTNLRDWFANDFEVFHQFRIWIGLSHHRYDVPLLIKDVPCVQFELMIPSVNPRVAQEQIVDYKNDTDNGYIWNSTDIGMRILDFRCGELSGFPLPEVA